MIYRDASCYILLPVVTSEYKINPNPSPIIMIGNWFGFRALGAAIHKGHKKILTYQRFAAMRSVYKRRKLPPMDRQAPKNTPGCIRSSTSGILSYSEALVNPFLQKTLHAARVSSLATARVVIFWEDHLMFTNECFVAIPRKIPGFTEILIDFFYDLAMHTSAPLAHCKTQAKIQKEGVTQS